MHLFSVNSCGLSALTRAMSSGEKGGCFHPSWRLGKKRKGEIDIGVYVVFSVLCVMLCMLLMLCHVVCVGYVLLVLAGFS